MGTINSKTFGTSFREWKFCQFELNRLRQINWMECPACEHQQHSVHIGWQYETLSIQICWNVSILHAEREYSNVMKLHCNYLPYIPIICLYKKYVILFQ